MVGPPGSGVSHIANTVITVVPVALFVSISLALTLGDHDGVAWAAEALAVAAWWFTRSLRG